MDPILSNSSPGHDDQIARQRVLDMAGLTSNLAGHDSAGPTIDQRLARIPIIEDHTSINRWNTAFIASVLHPLSHPFVDPSGAEKPWRERFRVMR